MELLELVNGVVVPSKFAVITRPFKEVWDDDNTENKVNAIRAFTYVELLCSPKRSNVFSLYDEDARIPKVKENVYGDPEHQLEPEIMYCVMAYKEFLDQESSYYGLLTTAINTAVKTREYFDGFSYNQRTNSGGMLIKPKEILAALNEVPDTIKRLEELRAKVSSDLSEEGKTTKEREVGPYEM